MDPQTRLGMSRRSNVHATGKSLTRGMAGSLWLSSLVWKTAYLRILELSNRVCCDKGCPFTADYGFSFPRRYTLMIPNNTKHLGT
jgi:hypothetical protein